MKKALIILYLKLLLLGNTLKAEVVLDGTLGFQGPLTGPNYILNAELGKQQGTNLFHSFSDFNLNSDESITFLGPESINNIINRVTGGNPSNINGRLSSAIPNADIYFINPFGVVFGPNAALDIPGSFHVSTADVLYLQDGGQFDASQPSKSIFTSAAPAAFGFLNSPPASLSLEGSQLSVATGKSFSVIGGHIKIAQSQIDAPSGRLNLASIVNKGKVIPEVDGLTSLGERGDLTVMDSQLSTSSEGGGTIYIRAGRFLLDKSGVTAETWGAQNGHEINVDVTSLAATRGGYLSTSSTGASSAGNINIQATGEIELSGENESGVSGIFTNSGSFEKRDENTGNAGNISLKANQLKVGDGALIMTSSYNIGKSGDISITVDDAVNVFGESAIRENILKKSSILAENFSQNEKAVQGGTINIKAKQLYVTQGGKISSSTIGPAQGGNINLKVTNDVVVSGTTSSGASSLITVFASGSGNAGNLLLEAKRLNVRNGAQVSAFTNAGKGGNISAKVTEEVIISGSYHSPARSSPLLSGIIVASTQGNGGNIILETQKLTLEQGGNLTAQTLGSGNAGNIFVKAANGTHLSSEGGIFTKSAQGNGGVVILTTPKLNLENNGQILATASGVGKGGDIEIEVDRAYLTAGSIISASSEKEGNAGQIKLSVEKILYLKESSIQTETQISDGGNIAIISPGYLRLANSRISTSVKAENGDGGNIVLQPTFIILNDSKIIAQAFRGKGGNIDIKAVGIYNFDSQQQLSEFINASSKLGVEGEVNIDSPDKNAIKGLIILPTVFLPIDASLKQCGDSHGDSHIKIHSLRSSPPTPGDFQAYHFLF